MKYFGKKGESGWRKLVAKMLVVAECGVIRTRFPITNHFCICLEIFLMFKIERTSSMA